MGHREVTGRGISASGPSKQILAFQPSLAALRIGGWGGGGWDRAWWQIIRVQILALGNLRQIS